MSISTGPARTGPRPESACAADLQYRLRADGAVYEAAVRELRELMLRAAWHQAGQLAGIHTRLGRRRIDDAIQSAADEATVAVLARLATFQGRSRFTTWAYKFGILHASVELRRAAWRHVDVDLASLGEPLSTSPTPQDHAEVGALVAALKCAIDTELTAHQRGVVLALLVEEVPIDVLAFRLGSSRNALYKVLHDSRKKLRAHLVGRGYLDDYQRDEEVMS